MIKHKKKGIKTRSINRFLKSEFDNSKHVGELSYDTFVKLTKPNVNNCNQCGIKYWNEKRCKCDKI